MNESEELKPCPECGGEAQIVEPVEGTFIVYCTECGLHYQTFTDKDLAVSDWNKRTINAQLKPCPFCGCYANILRGSEFSNDYWFVSCGRCLARTREVNSPDDAIGLWNKRFSPGNWVYKDTDHD